MWTFYGLFAHSSPHASFRCDSQCCLNILHTSCHRWFCFSTTEIWQWNYKLSGYECPLLNLKYKFSLASSWGNFLWFPGTISKAQASYFQLLSEHLHPELPQAPQSHIRKVTSSPFPSPQPLLWNTHPHSPLPKPGTLIIAFPSLSPTSHDMSNPMDFPYLVSLSPYAMQ